MLTNGHEVADAQNLIYLRLQIICWGSLIAFIALRSAFKLGYFKSETKAVTVPPLIAASIFGLFLVLQLIILPLLLSAGLLLLGDTFRFTEKEQGWLNLIAILGVSAILFLCCFKKWSYLAPLFRNGSITRALLLGAFSWVLAYPIILVVSQFLILLLSDLGGYTLDDQVAVKQIKYVWGYPTLFGATLITVIFVIPLLEEFLFRGLLQSALRNFLPAGQSILLSSMFFALFHFSWSQGINNINIILSLFVLSLFLGFLREKEGNLWPSIALHGIFNAVSIGMILLQIDL